MTELETAIVTALEHMVVSLQGLESLQASTLERLARLEDGLLAHGIAVARPGWNALSGSARIIQPPPAELHPHGRIVEPVDPARP